MVIWKRDEIVVSEQLKNLLIELFERLSHFKQFSSKTIRSYVPDPTEMDRLILWHGDFCVKREDFL